MPNGTDHRFWLHVVLASVVLLTALWLSSGTMAPYAATLDHPLTVGPCRYVLNIDHDHFVSIFRMLRGEPRDSWQRSVVLRRVLFPLIAMPFVRAFGLLGGGFIASALLQLAALVGFSLFARRRVGERGALAIVWLLATYPGITYYGALPYAYVMIVPGSIVSLVCLYHLSEASSAAEVAGFSAVLGIVFLGYDLLPIFGPAAVLTLVARRRLVPAIMASVVIVAPTVLLVLIFASAHIPLQNANTIAYANLIHAYTRPRDVLLWLHMLADLPMVFISNFVYGNFVILPMLFCGAVFIAWRRHLRILEIPEVALILSTVAFFLLNNAAPHYQGMMLRGEWMGRLYQPVFPAYLLAIGRLTEHVRPKSIWAVCVAAGVVANASVAFGPVLLNPVASEVYYRFYPHAPTDVLAHPQSLRMNIRKLGRWPLGTCR